MSKCNYSSLLSPLIESNIQANVKMLFTCALCLERKHTSRNNTIVLVNANAEICTDCFHDQVVPQFWNSIRHPAEFPFHFGTTPLRFQDYARHIPAYQVMLRAYNAKKDELETPAELRVYCDRDSTFLGVKKTAEELEEGEAKSEHECDICGRLICVKCMKHAAANHVCQTDSKEEAFQGLEKGKDYQLCPTCSAPFALEDGCNAVTCRICKTQFCILCGEAVEHGNKEHWQPGKPCPRFNQPGATNAMFDDEEVVVDDPNPQDDDPEELSRAAKAHWAPLFRARLASARQQLRDFRYRIRSIRNTKGDIPHLDHTLELIQNLIVNYGVFNVQADIAIDPAEHVVNGRVKVLDQHRQIREFADLPAAAWAWANFAGLRELRLLYLNHIGFEVQGQIPVDGWDGRQIQFNYGNPLIDDALSGAW